MGGHKIATVNWYVRTGGNDLNSGGEDTDAATITRDSGTDAVVTGSTLVDSTNGGFTGLDVTKAINLQIGGDSTIVEISSITNDTTIELTSSPGDGSYNYRVGGARDVIEKVARIGTGNNARIASGDDVWIQAGTYTENMSFSVASTNWGVSDPTNGQVVIDGTGGAAGSDVFNLTNNASMTFNGIDFINGVDNGAATTSTAAARVFNNCKFKNNGTDGNNMRPSRIFWCESSGNGQFGIQVVGKRPLVYACSIINNTDRGTTAGANLWANYIKCIISDNGDDGIFHRPSTSAGDKYIINCVIDGNTGNGVDNSSGGYANNGALIVNNVFSNNGEWGYLGDSSPITKPTDFVNGLVNTNIFFGNTSGAHSDFEDGQNYSTADPKFVDQANRDFTPDIGSPMIEGGFTAFESPNKENIGTSEHGEGGAGTNATFVS